MIEEVLNDASTARDVTGLRISGQGQAHFSAGTLAITAQSASNVYPVEDGWPQLTAGISVFGPGTVTTAASTNLTVTAQSTGAGTTPSLDWNESLEDSIDKNNFAGFVAGVNAEGGTFDFKGNTTVTATGDGAYVEGLSLQALAGDSEWVQEHYDALTAEDFSTTATFGGDLTVTAKSNTSGAEGIRLGGYVPGEGDPDGTYAYPEGVKVVMNTSATGTTTITATTSSQTHESVGVNFVYPDAEGENPIDTPEEFTTGRGYLNLNGKTVITADHALKGEVGYVTNKGELVLNGRVDAFEGEFTQTAGSTVLNDAQGGFFGGKVDVRGGSLTAEDAVWNSADAGLLSVSDAEVTLRRFNVASAGSLQFASSKVTAETFNLDENVTLSLGNSTITLNGNEEEDSRIAGTLTDIGSMIVNGGTLDLTENATLSFVEGAELIFNKGAFFSAAGNMEGADLIFNDGSALYDSSANEEFHIEGGNVTFNGQVELLTGDSDNVKPITTLILGPNNSTDPEPDPNVTFDGGAYDFENVQTLVGTLTFAGEEGKVSIGNLTVDEGKVNVAGGVVKVDKLAFGNGTLSINGGTLQTYTNQIFQAGVGEQGTITDPQGLKNPDGIEFTKGTLAFDDAYYNDFYKTEAGKLAGSGVSVVFNGENVDLEQGDVSLGDIEDKKDVIQSNVNVTISNPLTGNSVVIDKSFGVSTIKTEDGVKEIVINFDKEVTLVGGDGKELISGGKDVSLTIGGLLGLGHEGSNNNSGTLSSSVTIDADGKLLVQAGDFTLADVTSNGTVEVSGGKATVGNLTLNGSSVQVGKDADFSAGTVSFGSGSSTLIGALVVDAVKKLENVADSIFNIGTTGDEGKAGSLTLKGNSLGGLTYFLDPVYVDGQGLEGASNLIYAGTALDGKVVVGENSYAVFGSTDDAALKAVFDNGTLSWGSEKGKVLSAVYVASSIDVTQGGLRVDGTVNQNSDDEFKTVDAGNVVFAANSALVADVSNLEDGTALIKANSVTVEAGSKAVLVGDLKQGVNYQLTNIVDANKNWAGNIVAGNGMWKLEMDANGAIGATLQDAALVYGSAMQGSALANAGMQAGGADYDYVNALLTDASGNISALPSIAERFDAAMNPAGALTSFTTAYDRASDLRRIVREESVKGQGNRLWAQVSGGVTKLDGISSGGRSINTETNAYGLTVGGEVEFSDYVFGAAFAGGTGHTDNDSVDGRDDFNYYGLSLYGKASLGGFNLLGDVSATWLDSDFTIGGAADVDADTTTAVYSFGLQAEKTFELSWADFTPFIGVDVYHVRSEGFSNGHGARIDDSDATAVEIPVGARLSKSVETTGGFHVAPSFMLAVVPTVSDTEIDSKVTFAGADSTYDFTFVDDVKVRSNIALDAVKDNFTFGLGAGYEWGNEQRSSFNFKLRAKYAF